MNTRRLRYEVALVLALTFGMAGLRSIFTLIDALSTPLNTQSVTLNAPRATAAWLDFALQLCGAATIMTWGLLALFLLGERLEKPRGADFSWGVGLAALIGIPGLGFYYAAVHLGLSKEVIPSTLEHFWTIPVLLLFSFAHAFAEEIVVAELAEHKAQPTRPRPYFHLGGQCPAAWQLPPLPRRFRRYRQRDHGAYLWLVLSALPPHIHLATDHRPLPYRCSRICRLYACHDAQHQRFLVRSFTMNTPMAIAPIPKSMSPGTRNHRISVNTGL